MARVFVVGVALGLGLVGCTGGAVEVPEAEWVPWSERSYPLDPYDAEVPRRTYAGPEYDAELREIENRIAACMATEGFAYEPVPWTTPTPLPVPELDLEPNTQEFAERYGYGILLDPFGYDPLRPIEAAADNPNLEYVATMSQAELEAYVVALYGVDALTWEYTGYHLGRTPPDPSSGGCAGHAATEVIARWPDVTNQEWQPLWDDLNALSSSVDEDLRVVAALQGWSECMADLDHPDLAWFDDAQTPFWELRQSAYDEGYAAFPVEMREGVEVQDEEGFDRHVQRRLAELADEHGEEEIATALDDRGCRTASRFDDVYFDVRTEYEQHFLDTHRAELEAWVLAHEGLGP